MIAQDIRYGFELEAYYDDEWLEDMEPSDYHDGDARDDLNGYRLEKDGSLHSDYGDLSPAELISPVLHYDNFENDMDTLREMLKDVTIKTDSTCGLHINISTRGYNIRDTWTIAKVKKARDEFLKRTENGNYFRTYAKKIDSYRMMFSGERYLEFNMRHSDYIEWRAVNVGSCDDIEEVIKTIKTALDCVSIAINSSDADTFTIAYDDSSQYNCDYFEYVHRLARQERIERGLCQLPYRQERMECDLRQLPYRTSPHAQHIPSIRRRRRHNSSIRTIEIVQVYSFTKKEI